MFLERSLIDGVRHLDVDQDIRQVMVLAIKGALDFTFTDIQRGDEEVPDFFELLPMFGSVIGELLSNMLLELPFVDQAFAEEILGEVGIQVNNPSGINF